jgi:hypothetical protein
VEDPGTQVGAKQESPSARGPQHIQGDRGAAVPKTALTAGTGRQGPLQRPSTAATEGAGELDVGHGPNHPRGGTEADDEAQYPKACTPQRCERRRPKKTEGISSVTGQWRWAGGGGGGSGRVCNTPAYLGTRWSTTRLVEHARSKGPGVARGARGKKTPLKMGGCGRTNGPSLREAGGGGQGRRGGESKSGG